MDRIERVARSVEARIKKFNDGEKELDQDIEYKGLLSKMKKAPEKKEKDEMDVVAEYVQEIRKAKEEILNGRK